MSRPVCWHEPLVSGCPDCFAFLRESASSLSQLEEMLKSGWWVTFCPCISMGENGVTIRATLGELKKPAEVSGPTLSSAIQQLREKIG